MSVTVLFFARYREALDLDSLDVEGDFATVGALRQALAGDPGFEVLNEPGLMCARNEEICTLDEPLVDGDEVAFFPPVTGG